MSDKSTSLYNNNVEDEMAGNVSSPSAFLVLLEKFFTSKDPRNEGLFLRDLIITFRLYITAAELFNRCCDRYQRYKSKGILGSVSRVVAFMNEWIDENYSKWGLKKKMIFEWLDIIKADSQTRNKFNLLLLKDGRSSAATVPVGSPVILRSINSSANTILDLRSNCIVACLTNLEVELFKAVQPFEFFNWVWIKKKEKEKFCPNITQMVNRFNQISYWVAYEIINTKPKHQEEVLEKFIKIAKKCEFVGNYNTLMEILSGLNNVAILRLTRLWNRISAPSRETFEGLEDLMKPQQNFKNYREAIKTRKNIILPYFAIFTRDFTFCGEGNQLSLNNGQVNQEILPIISSIMQEFLFFQNHKYVRMTSDSITDLYLRNFHTIDDEELYKLSVMIQNPPHIFQNYNSDSSNVEEDQSPPDWMNYDSQGDKFPSSVYPTTFPMNTLPLQSNTDKTFKKEKINVGESFLVQALSEPVPDRRRPRSRRAQKCTTINVPDNFQSVFSRAEQTVAQYFEKCVQVPHKGTIRIWGDRFVLFRGASLADDLVSVIRKVTKDEDYDMSHLSGFLYDLSHAMGMFDAKNFKEKMGVKGLDLVTSGLVYSSFCGWSLLSVDSCSNPALVNYHLQMNYQSSIEARSWNRGLNKMGKNLACVMNSGFHSGWCEAATGLELVSAEMTCVAQQDHHCKVIMAKKEEIQDKVLEYIEKNNFSEEKMERITIHAFLDAVRSQMKEFQDNMNATKSKKAKTWSKVFSRQSRLKRIPSVSSDEIQDLIKKQHQIYLSSSEMVFKDLLCVPNKGTVSFNNEGYVFVRAGSFAVEFFCLMKSLFEKSNESMATKFATCTLYEFASYIGRANQEDFAHKMADFALSPIERLLGLPASFAHTGWGKMVINMETLSLHPDNFHCSFDVHASCEVECWSNQNEAKGNNCPTCIMQAGIAAGWASQCFGLSLVCAEIICASTSEGYDYCRFVISTPDKISDYVSFHMNQLNLGSFLGLILSHLDTYLSYI